jgi:hypothetical protein
MARHSAARIRLSPSTVAPASLAAALFSLMDQPPERLVVSHRNDGCGDELFANLRKAIDRVAELMSTAQTATPEPAFLREERSLTSLLDEDSHLSALFRFCADAGHRYNPATDLQRLEDMLKGRFMIVEVKTDRLMIAEVGTGFIAYDARWRARAHGLRVEDQPDYAYGCWARDAFLDALRRNQPRVDNVDAIIRRPYLSDQIRVRYRMIILPFSRGASQAPCLLGASVIDDRIDLRAKRN